VLYAITEAEGILLELMVDRGPEDMATDIIVVRIEAYTCDADCFL
jgi:hypothetical protein